MSGDLQRFVISTLNKDLRPCRTEDTQDSYSNWLWPLTRTPWSDMIPQKSEAYFVILIPNILENFRFSEFKFLIFHSNVFLV